MLSIWIIFFLEFTSIIEAIPDGTKIRMLVSSSSKYAKMTIWLNARQMTDLTEIPVVVRRFFQNLMSFLKAKNSNRIFKNKNKWNQYFVIELQF